jgi:hypothetical protein
VIQDLGILVWDPRHYSVLLLFMDGVDAFCCVSSKCSTALCLKH